MRVIHESSVVLFPHHLPRVPRPPHPISLQGRRLVFDLLCGGLLSGSSSDLISPEQNVIVDPRPTHPSRIHDLDDLIGAGEGGGLEGELGLIQPVELDLLGGALIIDHLDRRVRKTFSCFDK
jgi:hypothetical protein